IKRACGRFESEWQSGRRPRIEDYLDEVPEPGRPELLRTLLVLDLVYRRRGGERPMPGEYRARFPGQMGSIDAAFSELQAFAGAPALAPRFRILRLHARGGLGEVFAARDQELNREVALKQIQDQYADDPESRHRFRLEAEITGRLEHPGVVPV